MNEPLSTSWRFRSTALRGAVIALLLAVPVVIEFRGLLTGQNYQDTWFYAFDPIYAQARTFSLPPRMRWIWDVSPPVLNATADRFASNTLCNGELPLWNPYQALGTPLAAELHSSVMSPFRWLLLYLPGSSDYASSVFAAAEILLGVVGVFLWLRSQRLDERAAVVGAIPYAFTGGVLDAFRFSDLPAAMAAPWLLWRIEVLIERATLRNAVLLGSFAGLVVLSAHPGAAFVAVSSSAAYFVARVVENARKSATRETLHIVSLGAAAALQAQAVAAPVLFEFATLRSQGVTYKDTGVDIGTFVPSELFNPDHHSRSYIVVTSLVWGLVGLFAKGGPRLGVLVLAAIGFGQMYDPPIIGWVRDLPGYNLCPPGYAHFLVALGTGALMARALHHLPRQGIRASLAAAMVLPVVVALTYAYWGALPRNGEEWPGWLMPARVCGLFIGCMAVVRLAWMPFDKHRRVRIGGLVGVLLVAILVEALPKANDMIVPEPAFDFPQTDAVAFLQRHTRHGARVTGLDHGHWHEPGFAIHTPNVGLVTRIGDVRSYQALFVRRTRMFMQAASPQQVWTWLLTPSYPGMIGGGDRPTAFELVGVRYFLRLPHEAVPTGHHTVFQDAHVAIDENPRAFERAFLVHESVEVADADAALAALPLTDLGKTALIEPAEGESGRLSGSAPVGQADERVAWWEPGSLEQRVHAVVRAPAWLVVADTYYPGWVATVDGRTVPIHAADLALRAVRLEPGDHQVRFVYRPRGLVVGVPLAGAAWALALTVLCAPWVIRARRRNPSVGPARAGAPLEK